MPPWHPHFEVWLLVAILVGGYLLALRRLGPRHVPAGQRAASASQMASWFWGVALIWVASDWPVHDVAERSLYSVHMVQHMVLALIAPPFFLLGTPAWLARELLAPPTLYRVVRRLTRPIPALITFNVFIVVTHWPTYVDLTLRSQPIHFATHAVFFTSALIMWSPVLSPLPEMRLASPPAQMLYLFLQSIVPTVPASFLVFADRPLYHFYEHAPRLWGLAPEVDQQIAGLILKLAGGLVLWMIIAVIFFRWHSADEESDQRARGWQALERELDAGLAPPGSPWSTDGGLKDDAA